MFVFRSKLMLKFRTDFHIHKINKGINSITIFSIETIHIYGRTNSHAIELMNTENKTTFIVRT